MKYPSLKIFFCCIFLLFTSLFLTGCASPDIYNNPSFNPPVYFGFHRVEKGDTLYSIAWRYGRNYKELAVANGISPPYVIHVGQKIRLDLTADSMRKMALSERHSKENKNHENDIKSTKMHQKNSVKLTQTDSQFKPLKHSSAAGKIRLVDGVAWQWPYVGKIIAGYNPAFSSNRSSRDLRRVGNKGIDIKGKLGDPIKAAASGEVVYAGQGLRGYGKLIIINHNDHYLSAYAHNNKMFVKEGQKVQAGDIIAEMGNTGAQQVALHFEIRKDGKPVNPNHFLP